MGRQDRVHPFCNRRTSCGSSAEEGTNARRHPASHRHRWVRSIGMWWNACRADGSAASSETTPHGQLVLQAIDADANGLKMLAAAVVTRPGYAAVLVSTSVPGLVVVARSADLPVRSNEVLSVLISRFGGR